MSPEPIEGIQALRAILPHVFIAALVSGSLAWLLFQARKSPLAPASEEPREPPLWSGGEVLLLFLVWLFVPFFLAVPLLASGIAINGFIGEILIGGVGQLLACGFALYLLMGRLGQPPATLGLAPATAGQIAGTVLLFFLTLAPLALVASVWTLFLHDGLGLDVPPQPLVLVLKKKIEEREFAYVAALAAGAVIVAPIVEEVLFRGLLFGWLRAHMGTAAGAIISSAIFGSLHGSLTVFASLTFLALVLCALYVRTGSILPGMLFHAMLNGQMILLLVLRSAGEETS